MPQRELPMVSVTPGLELLYTSAIEIAEPLNLGATPRGQRRIINIIGGAFSGPKLSGRVLPGGADWQFERVDGVMEVEARYTLETDDGELIYITNWGYRHGPPEVLRRLAAGERVDPAEYYFRTNPRYETAAKKYAWLNGIIAVAAGERQADRVMITVYEVK